MKPFPVDIWSVKRYGVEAWLNECTWPVPDWESRCLLNDVQGLLLRVAEEAGPDIGDTMLVLFKLATDHVMFIHAAMVRDRLGQQGIPIDYEDSTPHYPQLARGEPYQIGPGYNATAPESPGDWERLRGTAGTFLRRWKFHGYRQGHYLSGPSSNDYLAFHMPRPEMVTYASSSGKSIRIVHPQQFMPPARSAPFSGLPGLDHAVDQYLQGLQLIAERYGVRLDEGTLRSLGDTVLTELRKVEGYIEGARRLLSKRPPTSFLVDGFGNTFKRCFCVATRREGHEVVGFTHGNTFGMFNNNAYWSVDLLMADVYVLPTPGAVRMFSKLLSVRPLPFNREIKLVSANTPEYQQMWEEHQRGPAPTASGGAMLVEGILTPIRYAGQYAFWPFGLEFVLRIANTVRRNGIGIACKRHPDRLAESNGIYEPYFDETLTQRFEEVYRRADAYLFPYLGTTTFVIALLTNKPVICFEVMLADVWEELHPLLRKRCRVVPSSFNTEGKLIFDEAALVDALTQEPGPVDDELIRTLMFPE